MHRGSYSYHPLGGCGEDMSEGERMAMEAMDSEFEDPENFEDQAAEARLDHIDAPVGVWNATSGFIPMVDMTDEHLKNALAWLARYGLSDAEKAAEIRKEQARREAGGEPATGRALDLDMFNDRAPYELRRRLCQAAQRVGARIVGDGYIALENKKMAQAVADNVNADLPKTATIKLTGAALWDLALFEKTKRWPPSSSR